MHLKSDGTRVALPDERVHPEYDLCDSGNGWFELSPVGKPGTIYRLPESDIVEYFVQKQLKRVDGQNWPG
jgi:hypothetical protein